MDLWTNRAKHLKDNPRKLRDIIYDGGIFLETNIQATTNLCAYAIECITTVMGQSGDPRTIHNRLDVKSFIKSTVELKKQFTNSDRAKECIRDFLFEIEEKPSDYLLQKPSIRVIPNYQYLRAGVSYAYKPHRDTWYGGAQSQINTWMPVFSIDPEQTMWISPHYFDKAVANSSGDWSVQDWLDTQRWAASENISEETRPHPLPLTEVDSTHELKIGGDSGNLLIFSGCHLHGSVPNLTKHVRYSVDFRVHHLSDLENGKGPKNFDNYCKDTNAGLKDFFHASDFSPYESEAK